MVKYNGGYSQQEDTGTLMARTTHTMSILVRQMVARLSGVLTSGPDWFPVTPYPFVVVDTLLPFVPDRSSEVESFMRGGGFSDVLRLASLELVPVSVTLLWEEKASLVTYLGIFVPATMCAELPLTETLAVTAGTVTLFVSECSVE